MSPRRETLLFGVALAGLVTAVLHESLIGGKVLSPADVVYVEASFREFKGPEYEPANRLLMDPVLQFEPWLEFSRAMLRRGRLPLWNSLAGCGAPHLANGQAAVFDPFHAIAYLGTLPAALGEMAAARLWVAGMGMFLLARAWGLGRWGRWFAGLAFPLCGFVIGWLLYPSASVAVWMPWLFLATERVLDRPEAQRVGVLGLVAGCVLLGGQVQVSAHILIAAAGSAAWRIGRCPLPLKGSFTWKRRLAAWGAGITLGVALGAIEVVPLGCYLAKSPVWTDRAAERTAAWRLERPRLLDAVSTAWPYAFGSQRRGQPNLAKALGVQNLNESAGGFAGLATLIWLAPLGCCAPGGGPRARFLAIIVLVGGMGAFGVPPVSNLLRAIPVLDVTDNRRLCLWVAFGLILLGGIGLDHLDETRRGRFRGGWVGVWVAGAIGMMIVAGAVGWTGPRLRARALAHYAQAAAETPGADPAAYRRRAERQVRQTLRFVPRSYGLAAVHLLTLAALAMALRRGKVSCPVARTVVLGLTLVDLLGFGIGLNPAIDPEDYRPEGEVIADLKRTAAPPSRIVAVGAELPPNLLMRYGLADVRNYDSLELANSLAWFGPLYEPEPGRSERTSRRRITWQGVIRSRDRLAAAEVAAIVGDTPPPPGSFARVDRVGAVWIARLGPEHRPALTVETRDDGRIMILPAPDHRGATITLPETFDGGWRAEVDGRPAAVAADRGAFLSVAVPSGARRVVLRYDPPEVRLALAVSTTALGAIGLALAWPLAARAVRARRELGRGGSIPSRGSDQFRVDSRTARENRPE